MKLPNIIESSNYKLPVNEYMVMVQEAPDSTRILQTITFHVPVNEKVEEFVTKDTEYTNNLRKALAEINSKFPQWAIYKIRSKHQFIKNCNFDLKILGNVNIPT
jgi:hypothetical protein